MGQPSVKANLFPPSQAPPAQMVSGGEPTLWPRLIPMTQFCLPVAIWVTWTAGRHPSGPVLHPPSPLWYFRFSGPAAPRTLREGNQRFLFHWPFCEPWISLPLPLLLLCPLPRIHFPLLTLTEPNSFHPFMSSLEASKKPSCVSA